MSCAACNSDSALRPLVRVKSVLAEPARFQPTALLPSFFDSDVVFAFHIIRMFGVGIVKMIDKMLMVGEKKM